MRRAIREAKIRAYAAVALAALACADAALRAGMRETSRRFVELGTALVERALDVQEAR